jgi:16S rRNA pseudouridine516 synthase
MQIWQFLAKHHNAGRRQALQWLVEGRISIGDQIVRDKTRELLWYERVCIGDTEIRPLGNPTYIMLHKPPGHVSATTDPIHPTVLDLVNHPEKSALHLAGRLDRWSSGLLLLTNDGHWSERITRSTASVAKVYKVGTENPLSESDVAAFVQGFHFPTENIVTRPARLEIIEPQLARVTLWEGRYHQIKRMFHRVGNKVCSLHREQIGSLRLPNDLAPGDWRVLSADEIQAATGN